MTDKEKIHSKWQLKIMRVLANNGLKELSFSDNDQFEFIRDGFNIKIHLTLTKDNGNRLIG